MKLEQKIQKEILDYLDAIGAHVAKISKTNRDGWPDIMGVLPGGKAIAIEVKRPGEDPSDLQAFHLDEIGARGALAFTARSVRDVEIALRLWLVN